MSEREKTHAKPTTLLETPFDRFSSALRQAGNSIFLLIPGVSCTSHHFCQHVHAQPKSSKNRLKSGHPTHAKLVQRGAPIGQPAQADRGTSSCHSSNQGPAKKCLPGCGHLAAISRHKSARTRARTHTHTHTNTYIGEMQARLTKIHTHIHK